MKYFDGCDIKVGDKVRLGNDDGTVMCDVGAGKFSKSYAESEWAYLNEGIIIEFASLGIVHFTDQQIDLKLIERSRLT